MSGARITRASFLGLAAAAVAAPRAFGDIRDDIRVLQYLLTLEYIQSALYRDALKEVGDLSGETRRLVTTLRDQEVEHVDGLRATIAEAGGRPTERPSVDFDDALRTEASFLKLANTLEDTGVSGYNGAAPRFENTDFVAAFASLAQIEARHAALIRLARDRPPAPLPLDKASNEDAVRSALAPYRAD